MSSKEMKECEECGRKAGIVDALSRKRTYCVYVEQSERHPYKLLCQWCRGKE